MVFLDRDRSDLFGKESCTMKTISTILTACTFLFVSCDDFLAKKPKPRIESNCVMNGYGSGKCSFTNKGGPGSHCVKVKVFRRDNPKRSLTSSTICSGTVGSRETKSKDFWS